MYMTNFYLLGFLHQMKFISDWPVQSDDLGVHMRHFSD